MEAYSNILARKKEIVAITKADALTGEEIDALRQQLESTTDSTIYPLSSVSGAGKETLSRALLTLVEQYRNHSSG